MLLRGSLTAQVGTAFDEDGQVTKWKNGGKIGYLAADYGGEQENSTTNQGIGLSYATYTTNNDEIVETLVSAVKATSTNVGMSYKRPPYTKNGKTIQEGYYLSFQNPTKTNENTTAVLRAYDSSKGRIILDDDHIGIGFNGTNSYISIGEQVIQNNDWDSTKTYDNTITISADAINIKIDAENQFGIYARFA